MRRNQSSGTYHKYIFHSRLHISDTYIIIQKCHKKSIHIINFIIFSQKVFWILNNKSLIIVPFSRVLRYKDAINFSHFSSVKQKKEGIRACNNIVSKLYDSCHRIMVFGTARKIKIRQAQFFLFFMLDWLLTAVVIINKLWNKNRNIAFLCFIIIYAGGEEKNVKTVVFNHRT